MPYVKIIFPTNEVNATIPTLQISIGELKRRFSPSELSHNQIWTFQDRRVNDTDTFASLGIVPGSHITFTVTLPETSSPTLHVTVRTPDGRTKDVTTTGVSDYLGLCTLLADQFNQGTLNALRYKDNEGDTITIGSELEFQEARNLQGANLHLQAEVTPGTETSSPSSSPSSATPASNLCPHDRSCCRQHTRMFGHCPACCVENGKGTCCHNTAAWGRCCETHMSQIHSGPGYAVAYSNVNAGLTSPAATPAPAPAPAPVPTVTIAPVPTRQPHSATCDSCNQTIYGIRYKCSVCADYDLCETCEARNITLSYSIHPARHLFLKINSPNIHVPHRHANTVEARLTRVELQLAQLLGEQF